MTDNHGYNTPTQGTTDWDTLLNNNFTQLDGDVAIRDTEANRSNYTPKDDQEFIATDTGAVYIGDGTNWNKQSRELQSVDTDQATIGSASPVTGGPIGDSGDWLILSSNRYVNTPVTTTSTTYVSVLTGPDKVPVLLSDLTNVGSESLSLSVQAQNQTAGETTYIRIKGDSISEFTVGDTWTATTSPRTTSGVDAPPTTEQRDVEMKVSAGTGEIEQCVLNAEGQVI